MIRVNRHTKRYGSTVAGDHLSFEVRPGEVTGSLGPNGAAKSATMRMIVGLDAPTSGSVTVDGRRRTAPRGRRCYPPPDCWSRAALVGVLVLTPLVSGFLPSSFQQPVGKYFPAQADMSVFSVNREPNLLSPWVGYSILLAYVAAAFIVGAVLLIDRDA